MKNEKAPLWLHEELLLLALLEEKGMLMGGHMHFAVSGAVLTELLLSKRIEVSKGKKKIVSLVQTKPVHEPFCDEFLGKLRGSRKERTLQDWIPRLASTPKLVHRVALELCRKRILRLGERKVLWLFKMKVYPEVDPLPERRIRERLRNAIFGDSRTLKVRTVLLISLARSVGLLPRLFDRKALKKRKQRIERIVKGDLLGKATGDVIAAAQAAAAAAASMSLIMMSAMTAVNVGR